MSARWRTAITIVSVWTLYGLWMANQTYFEMLAMDMHHKYWRMLLWGIAIGNMWSLITPAILQITKRYPLERPRFARNLSVHLLTAGILCFVTCFGRTSFTILIHPFDPLTSHDRFLLQYKQNLVGAIPFVMFLYVAVAGVGHAIAYRNLARERELREAQLKALLSQAQVLSLKMQLHPHFLFNTLNGIVALIRDGDGDGAVEMLLGLSNMLRYALESSGRQEVSLREEIDFLNLYLGVEKMRFPDRLQVEMDIAPEAEGAMVPSLMLQPLVENAIRHGIAPRTARGTLMISAARKGDDLILEIDDDGVGMTEPDGAGSGIGLQNTRSRLAQLYDRFDFSIRSRPEGGVGVHIALPFRTVPLEAVLA